MTKKPNPTTLSDYVHSAREAKGYSFGQLSERSGVTKSGLFSIESGDRLTPAPATLQKLALALDVPLADLYALAGYEQPAVLPTLTPYLRSKYRDLPPEAAEEVATAFSRIARKYGIDPDHNGPAPGQDE